MDKKKVSRSWIVRLRPYVQGFFLLLFLILFFRVSYPFHDDFTKNFFFNLDPLITFLMVISGSPVKLSLLLSLVTILLTFLLGRVFCGWICPLGTLLDLFAHTIPRRKKKENSPNGNGRFKNIKYYLLGFLVFGSLTGFTAVVFFEPFIYVRFANYKVK